MPSVRSRDVVCAEWPYIRRFEHLLQLLDLVDDAFNVHAFPIISQKARMGQTIDWESFAVGNP